VGNNQSESKEWGKDDRMENSDNVVQTKSPHNQQYPSLDEGNKEGNKG